MAATHTQNLTCSSTDTTAVRITANLWEQFQRRAEVFLIVLLKQSIGSLADSSEDYFRLQHATPETTVITRCGRPFEYQRYTNDLAEEQRGGGATGRK